MEQAATSIQVLLQAAEFLESREQGAAGVRYPAEAEHGYASRSRRAAGSVRGLQGATRLPCSWLTGSLQRLEEQELRARKAKDWLRNQQQSLRQRLELLLSPPGGERVRADSLDSSQLSEPEDAEIEVDSVVFSGDLLPGFGTSRDHSYSSLRSTMS
ncbi:MAD3 protein, partial [Jacana jacana]|nr:MAD3 protein [Jacana jacana]